MTGPEWWTPAWSRDGEQDPDIGWAYDPIPETDSEVAEPEPAARSDAFSDDAILAPLEAQFGQTRSRERVRDLAEVFTHQREVDAMLDLIQDAFTALDVKFLEPACGSGNFLTEVQRRKLKLVTRAECVSQEHYEHRLLRAIASIYGVDISPENITEARARMAHVLLEQYQRDANTLEPTTGFLNAAALILGDNIVQGDTLNGAHLVELCDWQPHPGGCFRRVWTHALIPDGDRDLFWAEWVQDAEPTHFSTMLPTQSKKSAGRKARTSR